MSQQFEAELMGDLAADAPPTSADDAESALGMEGFEEDDAMSDEMTDAAEDEADAGEYGDDAFEEASSEEASAEGSEDVADAGETDVDDALEDAMADALDSGDADEFFGRLVSGISRVARSVGAGAGAAGQVGRVARRIGRVAGRASRSASPTASVLQRIVPLLRQYAAQGFDEMEAFEDMADRFAEEDMDAALPVLAGMAARTLVRPLVRRAAGRLARPVARRVVRGATEAARTLVQRRGPQAVRALPRIARSVARTAVIRRLPVTALPQAVRRSAARVAAHPQLVRRLAASAARVTPPPARARAGWGSPHRWRLRGPVEITIVSR